MKVLPWGRARQEESSEEEEEEVAARLVPLPNPLHVSPTQASLRPAVPDFDRRRFLRELSRPGQELGLQEGEGAPPHDTPLVAAVPRARSDRRIRLARDLLRSLTEPSPPPPSSPPSPPLPSLYSPVAGLHSSSPLPAPRYVPHSGEVGERIDRILHLSRRTRSITEAVARGRLEEREVARGEELLAQAAESAADVRRVVRAGRRVERSEEGEVGEEDRMAEGVETVDTLEREVRGEGRPAKRPRTDQFAADLEEAVRRSLRAPPAAPRPGCSHWGAPAPAPPRSPPPAPPQGGPDYEEQYHVLYRSHRRLVEALQGSLECPVCMETIRTAPVPCCRNGHLICGVCVQRTFLCPTCRCSKARELVEKKSIIVREVQRGLGRSREV